MLDGQWNTLPVVTCPGCDFEWQLEDYCDIDADTEIECPSCEKVIEVVSRAVIIEVWLKMKDSEGQIAIGACRWRGNA